MAEQGDEDTFAFEYEGQAAKTLFAAVLRTCQVGPCMHAQPCCDAYSALC